MADVTDDATDSAAYFEKMKNKQKVIASAQSILIIGGGPVGVELAGKCTWTLCIVN
jgi:NADH dehydrogenase FAD-containing subunit